MRKDYSLMIHGGAGDISHKSKDEKKEYIFEIKNILISGKELLKSKSDALNVVEACVQMLEDSPLFNAGKGSVLNEHGKVEMDAGIMNGKDMNAGAVAGIKNVQNPISLAKLVLEKSEHVMLIGEGAIKFGKMNSVKIKDDEYFLTNERIEQFKKAKQSNKVVLDHSVIVNKKFGTVGAVAMDTKGNLAAGTSTGGIVNKKYGRIGDSPIIGAGVFADNQTCAVSATGYGEQFIRTVISKTISDTILYKKINAQKAAELGIKYLIEKVNGLGGVIVIDSMGNCGQSFSTKGMIRGWLNKEKEIECKLD